MAAFPLLLGVVVGAAVEPQPGPVPPLTRMEDLRRLSLEAAARRPAVDVTGTVTWLDLSARGLFLQEQAAAVWVDADIPRPTLEGLRIGTRLRVAGVGNPGFFTPAIYGTNLQVLGTSTLPAALSVTGWDLRWGRWDGLRVEVAGTVFRAADANGRPELRLLADGVAIALAGPDAEAPSLPSLPRRGVAVGVSSLGVIDRVPVDCALLLSGWEAVRFDPSPLGPPPEVPLEAWVGATDPSWLDRPVRLGGVVTWREATRMAVQAGEAGVLVNLTNGICPPLGTRVTVTGTARRGVHRLDLVGREVQAGGLEPLPNPRRAGPKALGTFLKGAVRITVTGRLVHRRHTERGQEWLMVRPGSPEHFRLILPPGPLQPWLTSLAEDSTLEVTGVCRLEGADSDPNAEAGLLVSSDSDLRFLRGPPLSRELTLALAGVAGAAVLACLLGGAWWWHSLRLGRLRQAQLESENQLQRRLAVLAASASEQIAAQEMRLRTIVECMAEGILVVDAAATVASMNAAAERILAPAGTPGVGPGHPLEWLGPGPEGGLTADGESPVGYTLRTGVSLDAVLRGIPRLGGGIIWLSVNTRVLSRAADGSVREVIASFTDVSARQEAEEQRRSLEERLHRSEKLRAIGTLAGGVAHDFNNLLASILGNADLTLADLPPDHPVVANTLEIATAARRGADLVRRILSFSRPEIFPHVSLRLSEVVEEVAQVISRVLPPGVRFRWWTEPEEPRLLGDRTQLHQAVLNLCTNAVHALEQGGGDLEVSVSRTDPPGGPGSGVRLVVRDTGCGMSEAILSRVFEPFFTTKGPGRGTGLGMAIVHGVVEAHGGRLTVDSAPGRGTRVEVVLPAGVGEAEPAAPREMGDDPLGAGERLLVVDDDPAVLRTSARMLGRLGYEVVALGSPVAALEFVRTDQGPLHGVVTDLSMPEQSGVEMAQAMRALRPGLPVIVVTGYGPEAAAQMAQASCRFPILAKPFERATLAALLRQVLSGQPSEVELLPR